MNHWLKMVGISVVGLTTALSAFASDDEVTLSCHTPNTREWRALTLKKGGSKDVNFGIQKITWYELAPGLNEKGEAVANEEVELSLMEAYPTKSMPFFGAGISLDKGFIWAFAPTKSGGSELLIQAERMMTDQGSGIAWVVELKRDPHAKSESDGVYVMHRWMCVTPLDDGKNSESPEESTSPTDESESASPSAT